MANLDHLSYSSISTYLLCGHAWKQRYVDHVETPTAPALVTGSAFHDAAEAYISGKSTDLEAAWDEAWARQLERNSNIAWDTPIAAEAARDDGRRLVRAKPVVKLLGELRANFDPETCWTEKRIELRVPGVPVPIIGYIDLCTKDGVPGDFKTASRMWSDAKSSNELQPLFYLAALSQAGIQVPSWTFRHYVISKTQHPDAKTFEVQHKPGELFWLFEMVRSAWRGIEHEVYPMNPNTWKCDARYCEYWPTCRARYV